MCGRHILPLQGQGQPFISLYLRVTSTHAHMHIQAEVCSCLHVYTCKHIQAYKRIQKHVSVCVHGCTHTWLHIWTNKHKRILMHVHIRIIQLHLHTAMHAACVNPYMHAGIHQSTHTQTNKLHTHTCIATNTVCLVWLMQYPA